MFKDLAYIRSHSGLFIGLLPYVITIFNRDYKIHHYKQEDGLFTYQKKRKWSEMIGEAFE